MTHGLIHFSGLHGLYRPEKAFGPFLQDLLVLAAYSPQADLRDTAIEALLYATSTGTAVAITVLLPVASAASLLNIPVPVLQSSPLTAAEEYRHQEWPTEPLRYIVSGLKDMSEVQKTKSLCIVTNVLEVAPGIVLLSFSVFSSAQKQFLSLSFSVMSPGRISALSIPTPLL